MAGTNLTQHWSWPHLRTPKRVMSLACAAVGETVGFSSGLLGLLGWYGHQTASLPGLVPPPGLLASLELPATPAAQQASHQESQQPYSLASRPSEVQLYYLDTTPIRAGSRSPGLRLRGAGLNSGLQLL
jgi:hypothetical protein